MPRLLLVEDHDDTREMMAELLRVEGYDVVEAENGREALALLTNAGERAPDLILLDMAMPVMSGSELLAILDEQGRLESLPVVVLSASSSSADAQRARAFLQKPPDMQQLYKLLREFAGSDAAH